LTEIGTEKFLLGGSSADDVSVWVRAKLFLAVENKNKKKRARFLLAEKQSKKQPHTHTAEPAEGRRQTTTNTHHHCKLPLICCFPNDIGKPPTAHSERKKMMAGCINLGPAVSTVTGRGLTFRRRK